MSKLKCGLIQMGLKGDGTMSPEQTVQPLPDQRRLFQRTQICKKNSYHCVAPAPHLRGAFFHIALMSIIAARI